MKEICIIASVYNEEAGLELFYETAVGVLRSLCLSGTSSVCVTSGSIGSDGSCRPHCADISCGSGKPGSADVPNGSGSDGGSSNIGGDGGTDSSGYDYRICFVNDGSTDRSAEVLARLLKADPDHVQVITFSRNFGHEAAMTAGLDYSEGDIFIFMDSDLQHPPALIPEIVDKFEHGYEIVSMARTKNASAGRAKNLTSDLFYKLINKISETKLVPGASDFFAIDRKAADVLKNNYRERVRFMRGIVQNIGFNRAVVEYEAAERAAGKSHYNFKKLWKLSMDTLICFSELPLKLGIYAGFASGIAGIVLLIYLLFAGNGATSAIGTAGANGEANAASMIISNSMVGTAVAASAHNVLIALICFLCFMFAVMFVIIGILGEYLGVLFREVRDRPIYIVKNIEGGEILAPKEHPSGTKA